MSLWNIYLQSSFVTTVRGYASRGPQNCFEFREGGPDKRIVGIFDSNHTILLREFDVGWAERHKREVAQDIGEAMS